MILSEMIVLDKFNFNAGERDNLSRIFYALNDIDEGMKKLPSSADKNIWDFATMEIIKEFKSIVKNTNSQNLKCFLDEVNDLCDKKIDIFSNKKASYFSRLKPVVESAIKSLNKKSLRNSTSNRTYVDDDAYRPMFI